MVQSTDDMLDHFESDLNFKPVGIEFHYFLRRHAQVGADQNECAGIVIYQDKSQLFPDRLPNQFKKTDFQLLGLSIGVADLGKAERNVLNNKHS